jgi:hypothetical protein
MATATTPAPPRTTAAAAAGPILIDLDEASWDGLLDNAERFFGTVQLAQSAFRKMAADTAAGIREPHVRKYVGDIAERAAGHEARADDLFRAIGRDPARGRHTAGVLHAKTQEAAGVVVGWFGGAVGGWTRMRQLLFANLDAMGAWGMAEQLGYALGLPAVADLAFPIVNELSTQHLLIMEYVLEMGPAAVLLKQRA